MQQITAVWAGLDSRRRIIVALATVAMFAAVLALSRLAATPQMVLLYSGLESATAGEVVASLEQRGVTYDVRGGAIFVDANQRDMLRMTLASEGLPANGGAGYELLDNLSGFGTTSQMFDAAYWRAKEGELARTILAAPGVRAARVHIASATGGPFRRDAKPTAAVTVTSSGGPLSATQAKALRYLVASSVARMSPEDVAVIDSEIGLIVAGDDTHLAAASGDRAVQLKQNVEHLLAARMGPGRAVVEVSVDTVTERESIVERTFDPEGRVAISTDTEERSTASSDQGSGAVTVASNLPNGDGALGSSASSSNSETRERVNFEVSETQRELLRVPGAIRRISVAVLIDGQRVIDDSGAEVWQPLPQDELGALQDLVASAVGFDAARGDVITLRSMPFEPIPELGTVAAASLIDRLDPMLLAQLGVLALTALVLGVFVLRPLLLGRAAPAIAGMPAPASALSGALDDGILPDMAVNEATTPRATPEPPLALPAADPVERLRQMIEDRREETIQILRHWMEDEEETA